MSVKRQSNKYFNGVLSTYFRYRILIVLFFLKFDCNRKNVFIAEKLVKVYNLFVTLFQEELWNVSVTSSFLNIMGIKN